MEKVLSNTERIGFLLVKSPGLDSSFSPTIDETKSSLRLVPCDKRLTKIVRTFSMSILRLCLYYVSLKRLLINPFMVFGC